MTLGIGGMALGQQSQSSPNAPPEKPPASQEKNSTETAPASPKSDAQAGDQTPVLDPDTELRATVQQSAGDNGKLIQNLEAYLERHPDTPRRAAIYRGMMQAAMQMNDPKRALDYADKAVAIQPDDSQTLYLAVTVLEKMPDDASQVRAVEYDTRLIGLIAKANPESRPPQMSLEEWQAGRNKFTNELYVMRGRIERRLHKDDDAIKDLNIAFRLVPSSDAALALGEIAEQDKHTDDAARDYALALILSGQEQDVEPAARNAMRLRMENVWRFTHDSDAGLGEVFLSAFDKNQELIKEASLADKPEPVEYNKGATDPLEFSLRQVDGKGAVKLADSRGKVVILNFWTTWCAYCKTMEPMLADVRTKFADREDVLSLAVNADEDETGVAPFLQSQNFGGTMVFADGLDQSFKVVSIPTIIVLDRSGKIAYRTQGYAPDGFVDAVSSAITKAAGPSAK
jgi:thiol-disulfide isomerase/thioredoxin